MTTEERQIYWEDFYKAFANNTSPDQLVELSDIYLRLHDGPIP